MHINFQCHVHRCHIGNLKSAWKLANATSQGLIYCFVDYLRLKKVIETFQIIKKCSLNSKVFMCIASTL